MKIKQFVCFSLILLVLTSCNTVGWKVYQAEAVKIPLDKNTELVADESFKTFLAPYKNQLENVMNEVIGNAPETMRVHGPESLLSNFSADVYQQIASVHLQVPVDLSIVNLKGLRTQIPAGDITVSKVFELMPFENELVVLWVRGEELAALFDFFASIGGEGVSGMKMGMRDDKAVDVVIGDTPLDKNKVYVVATNDYLAEGNDGMTQLKNAEKRVNTGIKIRDMLIDYIRQETAEGRKIESQLDGRMYIVN
ncbi:MAG: 5'-nucleotidase [Paludibacter sp.]|nr:5'-nucleotidase [Paludibacter sp.]